MPLYFVINNKKKTNYMLKRDRMILESLTKIY